MRKIKDVNLVAKASPIDAPKNKKVYFLFSCSNSQRKYAIATKKKLSIVSSCAYLLSCILSMEKPVNADDKMPTLNPYSFLANKKVARIVSIPKISGTMRSPVSEVPEIAAAAKRYFERGGVSNM